MTKKHRKQKKSSSIKKIKINLKLITIILTGVILFFLFFSDLFLKSNREDEYKFMKEGTLRFLNSQGSVLVQIDIEIAENDYERELGLMFRKSMEEKQGMLFVFPGERVLSFWMRNTLIPLDMIFVNENKTIVSISKNAVPLTTNSHRSNAPAKYVVEVIGGFSDKYNIKAGDRIDWSRKK